MNMFSREEEGIRENSTDLEDKLCEGDEELSDYGSR